MAYQILLDAVLIVVTLFLLDRREARWAPRAARRDRSHLRPVPHSLRATPASERRKAS
jgi:hypothetical protein